MFEPPLEPGSDDVVPRLSFEDEPSLDELSEEEDDEDSAPEDSDELLLAEDPDVARESLR